MSAVTKKKFFIGRRYVPCPFVSRLCSNHFPTLYFPYILTINPSYEENHSHSVSVSRSICFLIPMIMAPARWLRFAPPPVTGLCTVSFGSRTKRMPFPSLARAGISSYSNLLEAIDILLLICRPYGAGISTRCPFL